MEAIKSFLNQYFVPNYRFYFSKQQYIKGDNVQETSHYCKINSFVSMSCISHCGFFHSNDCLAVHYPLLNTSHNVIVKALSNMQFVISGHTVILYIIAHTWLSLCIEVCKADKTATIPVDAIVVVGTIEELYLLKSDRAGEAASDCWVQGEERVQGCGS